MKQKNTRNQQKTQKNKAKIMLIVALIILAIIQIILLLNKKKNIGENKQQSILGMEVSIANTNFDITNQVAETPNAPVLSAGMIPIKYNGSNWVVTTTSDKSWYDYKNKKPAYIMLNDGTYSSEIMENKIVATSGTILQTNTMGTVFAWVPRFAYYSLNPRHDIIYLKEKSSIAGDYVTSDLFTCAGSGIKGQDIALEGIWVEQNGTLSSSKITSFNSETNTYGFIGNIKALEKKLDTDLVTAISQMDGNLIKNTSNSRAIIQVIDERVLEPIMASVTIKGTVITVEVQKAEYGIDRVLVLNNGTLTQLTETREGSNKYTMKVNKTGTYKIMVIDKQGNQKGCESNITVPKIEIITNQNDFVEYNGKQWYPYGTQVKLTYAESITGITPYYKQVNGTTDEEGEWVKSSVTTTTLTLEETTIIKVKVENAQHDIENEAEETIYIMPSDVRTLATSYRNNIGGTYPVQITTNTLVTQTLEGTGTYSYDTAIRQSATHIGLTDKIVYIKIVPSPQGGYIGSTRNGITTNNGTTNKNGYIFITENGQEIKLPQINKLEKTVEENKIKVQIDAKSYMGNIEKYYYSIDNGTYTETESNTHEFEAEPYTNHTIKVYVKDSFGLISQVQSTSSKTGNTLPTPTIEIVDEETIETVEYAGHTWYPYGTKIKITYAEDMTNLYGCYRWIDISTEEEDSVSATKSKEEIYTIYLSEIEYAKLQDRTGEESVEEEKEIYIMPKSNGYNSNQRVYFDTSKVGTIYPVIVTGTTSGNIYGTDTYSYDSNISKAATHLGLVDIDEEKVLYIKIVDNPQIGYTSSIKNGIASMNADVEERGYVFVTKYGVEIKSPQINNVSLALGETSVTATIGATANGTNITKYYYKIDDGEFIESTNSNYTFAEVAPYMNHAITVYAEDSNGAVSAETTKTFKTTKAIPTPTIEIVDKENIETVEYNGKTWYPYGTEIKITYAEDMTNLTGEYNLNNITDPSFERDWTDIDETEEVIEGNKLVRSVIQSRIYTARIKDSTGEYSAVAETEPIYIMPGTTLQENYATYTLGEVYPVKVTYTSTGTVYGLGTYSYSSNIAKAAEQMGLITAENTTPKLLYIKTLDAKQTNFKGGTNNGITSSNLNSYVGGYTFVNLNGEPVVTLPEITGLTITQDTSSKTVTVNAKAYNGASISKYYYSLNDGAYEASDSNVYTINNSTSTNLATVRVYVQDSNGNNSSASAVASGSKSEQLEFVDYSGYYTNSSGNTVTSSCSNYSWAYAYKTYFNLEDSCSGHRPNVSGYINLSNYIGQYVELNFTGYTKISYGGSSYSTQWSTNGYFYVNNSLIYDKTINTTSTTVTSEFSVKYVMYVTSSNYKVPVLARVRNSKTGNNFYGYLYINSPTVSIAVPTVSFSTTGTKVTDKDGVQWVPYNSNISINYNTMNTYYAYRYGTMTGTTNSYTLTGSSASYALTESSIWRVRDSSNVIDKSIEVNVMPYAEQMNSAYYDESRIGKIYPVNVTGIIKSTVNNNVYGTQKYRCDSNISKAATHMGLVKENETKLVYIKIISSPGTYKSSWNNGITSSSSTSTINGFVFVDEDGNEITDAIGTESTVKLSGYNVYSDTTYKFVQDGTAIKATTNSSNSAYSYIPLDLTNYTEDELVKITLNAKNGSISTYSYLAASIATYKSNFTYNTGYGSTYGRFVYLNGTGTTTAHDYSTVVPGGKMYYVCLAFYNTSTSSYSGYFNSLTVEKATSNATLSGYSVYPLGTYNFIQDGTTIKSNNTGTGSGYTTAKSCVVLDFRNYSKEDLVTVSLNASNKYTSYAHTYATIMPYYGTPNYSYTTYRFMDINTNTSATSSTTVQGGNIYYLYLGWYKSGSSTSTSYYGTFNSLTISSRKRNDITYSINESPVTDKNGIEWYPYNTEVAINYDAVNFSDTKYRKSSIDGLKTVSSSVTEYDWNLTNYGEVTISAGYTSDCTDISQDFNILLSPNGFADYANDDLYNSSKVGTVYAVQVTGTTSGTIKGTGKYTYDTNISTAARHMGLVDVGETKLLYVKVIENPEEGYKASTKNGTTSSGLSKVTNGFVFVTEDGREILQSPIINDLTIVGDEPSANGNITVTVNATPQTGATITKYIYQLDNGAIQESNTNTFVISNVNTYRTHTIYVVAKDSNGAMSEIKAVSKNITTAITGDPTITVDTTPIVDKDGKEWYPYGSILTIGFAEDMYDFTIEYSYIDERDGSKSEVQTCANKNYTTELVHSVTYIAKVKDSSGTETEEVRKTINVMPDAGDEDRVLYYQNYVGNVYPVKVKYTTEGRVYGTDAYRTSSTVSLAATHVGLVKQPGEEKLVYIKIIKAPEGGYIGSTRNGVTTSTSTSLLNGFVFVDENGEEISMPKITSTVVASGKDEITVTVTADSNIVKYYYSLDGINYTESTENKHTFAVLQSTSQTIRVYGIDNNGQQTPIKEITARIKMPVPTITANAEGITTPDGEVWYPYGTQFSINYASDMTGLTGKYKTTNMQTGTASNWQNATSSTSITLTETFKIDAYNYDAQGKEGELLSQIIYIMPNPENLQANYYEYCSGQTMPVMVTGRTGTGYGTDTYYNTPINVAAVHSNLVKAGEGPKLLYIKIVPCPEGGFKGSNKNGVQTQSLLEVHNGYQFVNK